MPLLNNYSTDRNNGCNNSAVNDDYFLRHHHKTLCIKDVAKQLLKNGMYTKIQYLNAEMNQERKVCVLAAVIIPSDLDLSTVLEDTSV